MGKLTYYDWEVRCNLATTRFYDIKNHVGRKSVTNPGGFSNGRGERKK